MVEDKGIEISPKYGVNPAIPKCFFCGDDKNEILLPGRIKEKGPGKSKDVEAPKGMVWDKVPCDKCEGYMKAGVILISVKDSDQGSDNPYRTGGWVVVSEDHVKRVMDDAMQKELLKSRVAFVPDKVWDAIGYPRGEANAV